MNVYIKIIVTQSDSYNKRTKKKYEQRRGGPGGERIEENFQKGAHFDGPL